MSRSSLDSERPNSPPANEKDTTEPPSQSPPELKHISIDDAPKITDDTESGWAAIAKSIQDVDEQKIKDYKEDIDTILVFAGLYSAVLSALLAESFQGLQPDPTHMMVVLLTQVVSQTHTYTINNGFLNSTVPPLNISSIQQFQPSLAARRVNVLWFASLTLSLMSASFGILVKQWLREYLSGEFVSPQTRLRIRHFRMPGLDHWGVFAIAALLPLVLQLALALFFIGLCFFTLDVHKSIGYTTVPLVCGWALLFVAASVAPALSPRCPYKVPLFKSVMRLTRTTLFHTVQLFKGLPSLPPKSEWPLARRWNWYLLGYDEEDAAKDTRCDIDILVDVDSSQTDDQLVMKMCMALKEMHASPEDTVDFVLKVINFRLDQKFTSPIPVMLDLSRLPVQTSTILMDAVADVLARQIKKFVLTEEIQYTPLMRDCLVLLLAQLPCLLTSSAAAVVSQCVSGTDARIVGTYKLLFEDVERGPESFKLTLRLQERLQNVFLHLEAYQAHAAMWKLMLSGCCTCDDYSSSCDAIRFVLQTHQSTIPAVLKENTLSILATYMLSQVKSGAEWNVWHQELLITLCSHKSKDEPQSWHGTLGRLIEHLLVDPKICVHFYRYLFDVSQYSPSVERLVQDVFPGSKEQEKILTIMHNMFANFLAESVKTPFMLNEGFYASMLYFLDGQLTIMTFLAKAGGQAFTRQCLLPLYQRLWDTMHTILARFDPSTVTEKQITWASTCLNKIEELDDLWFKTVDQEYEEWVKSFDPRMAFVGDSVIEDLMKFLPPSQEITHKRARRITDAKDAKSSPIASSSEI